MSEGREVIEYETAVRWTIRTMKIAETLVLLTYFEFFQTRQTVFGDCSRQKSRIVKDVIEHNLRNIYRTHGASMPKSCPFHPDRDVFHIHESHKTEESYGKWYCDFCGKGFYAESFLDDHLQNRHPDKLYLAPDSVCLSDYCDIFRCNVINGRSPANFWDSALCIEDDMSNMIEKCNKSFSSCLPKDVATDISLEVLNRTKAVVCGALTCNRYWYSNKVNSSEWRMLVKTFCTVMLIGFMIIYYFLAYHHFYTESFYEKPAPPRFKPYNPNLHLNKLYKDHMSQHGNNGNNGSAPKIRKKRHKRYVEPLL